MRGIFSTFLLIVGGGCIASHQSIVADVNAEWWGETKGFALHNTDTTTHRDIEIFVRYYPTATADSIPIFIDIESPTSLSIREKITLHLDKTATPRGECRVSRHPYRRDVVWSQVGDYKVDITPVVSVKGVTAIGVNTVKSE